MLALLGLAGGYFWLVALNPGEEIRRENIERILAMESPVYYRDGVNRIGVFFEQAHRQYITFQQIPPDFVNAIVAAEDSAFFSHYGIDFSGVMRAAIANFKARRVVQGGSTITQQTAKNLFKRQDRSLSAKLRELLYALRLEYHYSKEDILEFYANQFFVSGNGRGLGMAARYFFDKPVEELTLLESAFIAGSVKGPNHYNPFVKRSEEAAEQARRLARQRTGYVLEQMRRLGSIGEAELAANRGREIPFRQGRMTYALNTLLDLVREGLGEPEVVEALSRHGIDNVATSGIRIITAVDKNLQEEAHFALRKELSRLDIRLGGYDHRALQAVYAELPLGGVPGLPPSPFLVGRIAAIEGTARQPLIRVVFPSPRPGVSAGEHPTALLDRAGLFNLLTPLARYRQHAWSEAGNADLAALLAELRVDDLVYVSVREEGEEGELRLDLEKYPEVQGGVLALRDGAIVAMVGGRDNQHYNRAVTARRPVGSVMKPLVYAAALQLGWNSADVLDNRRNVFVYQNQAYFPRPLQEIRHEQVSLSWAGVLSENLASIWLLYHLTDQLPPARFAELVQRLGFARESGESLNAYTGRIRDRHGVVVDRAALWRTAFERAVEQVEADLLFDGRSEEYHRLQAFRYGAGFDRFGDEVRAELLAGGTSAAEQREGRLRLEILGRNYLDYLAKRDRLRELVDQLIAAQREPAAFRAGGAAGYDSPAGRLPFYRDEAGSVIYSEGQRQEGWRPLARPELLELLPAEPEAGRRFRQAVLIGGQLRVATLDLLEEAAGAEYARLAALPPYDPEVLYQTRDFRVLVSLHYLIGLSRALGIESPLEPVLSFPLGSNVLSLLETARSFEAMRDGMLHLNALRLDGGGLAIIERIEGSDGRLIYAPERRSRRVFSPRVALAMGDILANAMDHGTGRSAHNLVRLRSSDREQDRLLNELDLKVPLFGKTGTANRFVNATFAGYLPGPGPDRDHLGPTGGYTMAAYVGYDDNRPMVRGSTRITGGGGALPLWSRLAAAVYRYGEYAAALDLDELAFSGRERVAVAWPALGQVEIPVEAGQGGVVSNNPVPDSAGTATDRAAPRITTFGRVSPDGSFVPTRFFQPYWRDGEDQ